MLVYLVFILIGGKCNNDLSCLSFDAKGFAFAFHFIFSCGLFFFLIIYRSVFSISLSYLLLCKLENFMQRPPHWPWSTQPISIAWCMGMHWLERCSLKNFNPLQTLYLIARSWAISICSFTLRLESFIAIESLLTSIKGCS